MEEVSAIDAFEVDEQDVLQLWGRLHLTPEQRVQYLLGMLEFEHLARNARLVR